MTAFDMHGQAISNCPTIDGKLPIPTQITPDTATKITYDANGLVVSSAQAQINDIGGFHSDNPIVGQVLVFNGSEYINGAPQSLSPGAGINQFLTRTPSGIVGVDLMTKTPDSDAEIDETAVITSGTSPLLAYSYLSQDEIGYSQIPGGSWLLNLYCYVSTNAGTTTATLTFKLYHADTTETTLFSVTTPHITWQTVDLVPNFSSVQQAFNCVSTDKLKVDIYLNTTHPSPVTFHLIHSGTTHYSHWVTPIAVTHNQLPALQGGSSTERYHLTLAQLNNITSAASGTQNGYLTSTDWATFNGKQAALGFTPEDAANKSTSTADIASSVKFPVWSILVSWIQANFQTLNAKLTAISALANGAGWLKNNGAGVFSYTSITKSDVGLSDVENTALSTWGGSSTIATLGTVTAGIWHGTAIADTYIASAATWNAKQSALSFGNLTESTSAVLTITGGTGAVIGSGLSIQVKQASALQSGYLSATDWVTFNGKQAPLTLSITGNSGAATLVGSTLTIPNYTLAGLGYSDNNTINTSTSSYTAAASDLDTVANGNPIRAMSVVSANNFTIPNDSTLGLGGSYGQRITGYQAGAGQTTIAGVSGVTITGSPGLKCRAQTSFLRHYAHRLIHGL